jgi:hypothetical protein
MFTRKGVIAILSAAALCLAAGQAHAQGRGSCRGQQLGSGGVSNQQPRAGALLGGTSQQSARLTALQQQRNALLAVAQQQQLNALLLALQQQQIAQLAALQQLAQQQQVSQLRLLGSGP